MTESVHWAAVLSKGPDPGVIPFFSSQTASLFSKTSQFSSNP